MIYVDDMTHCAGICKNYIILQPSILMYLEVFKDLSDGGIAMMFIILVQLEL